jgi:hypothetical protein
MAVIFLLPCSHSEPSSVRLTLTSSSSAGDVTMMVLLVDSVAYSTAEYTHTSHTHYRTANAACLLLRAHKVLPDTSDVGSLDHQ